jgi:hypothetical protein
MQVSHDPRYFGIDPAQQMACGNTPFEIEEVKQLALIAALPPHHDSPPPLNESSERESWHPDNHEPFFNIIGQKQTFLWIAAMSALRPKADIPQRRLDVRQVPEAEIRRLSDPPRLREQELPAPASRFILPYRARRSGAANRGPLRRNMR